MKLSFYLVFLPLLFLVKKGHAEEGCPAGMLPANGNNINSCVPIPPGYYQQDRSHSANPPPMPLWEDRWGALATDTTTGVIGTATDMLSSDQAEKSAMNQCIKNGGTQCKSEGWYKDGCIALIVGDRNLNIQTGGSLNQAVDSGIKVCTKDDVNCHVYYSGCSLPVRIR